MRIIVVKPLGRRIYEEPEIVELKSVYDEQVMNLLPVEVAEKVLDVMMCTKEEAQMIGRMADGSWLVYVEEPTEESK